MANIFSNAFVQISDADATTIVTGDSQGSLVIELDICNTHSLEITTDIIISRAAVDYYFAKDVPIPVGSTLQAIAGQKIVLLSGDALKVKLTDDSFSCDVVCSILTEVNAD